MLKKDIKTGVGINLYKNDMKKIKLVIIVFLGFLTFSGCSKDDDNPSTRATGDLNLTITGLEDLGSDYAYEGWLIVGGNPVSAGVFNVDSSGDLSQTSFSIDKSDLDNATGYVITIEPSPDNDAGPSEVHILSGEFSDTNSAALTIDHDAALGEDFLDSTGSYFLATPSDNDFSLNESSGVWWIIEGDDALEPALSLPSLPSAWTYEGWAVVNGQPLSTGKFSSPIGADDFSGFSALDEETPDFPGEDFLINATDGFDFPAELLGSKIVISVEPIPENSPAPFLLKPLVADVSPTAEIHQSHDMENNALANNPVGVVVRL